MNYELLYFDVHYSEGDWDYLRVVMHHEFYHNIEEYLYGSSYYKDPAWDALNDAAFEYGSGGAACYTSMPVLQPGFVSAYAMCGLEEDKAETFGYLMTDKNKAEIEDMMQTDPILKNKIDYMVEEMRGLGLVITL